MPQLLQAMAQVASGEYVTRPHRLKQRDPQLDKAVQQLTQQIEAAFPNLPNARWVALRLLDGDETILHAVREGSLGDLQQAKRPESLTLELVPA